jgi:argininosuccinate lyase
MSMLWGGRFDGQMDQLMGEFQNSISFDQRLYRADIQGSQAYARALVHADLLTAQESDRIIDGLAQVLQEFDSGAFQFLVSDEDIHTAVERRLSELIGPVAGKLHTGRSRNDQVATDTRLHMMGQIDHLAKQLIALQSAFVTQADAHLDILMPGYTHVQPAQPILFSHWLMSFFWMLQRDRDRLTNLRERTAILPLGASALAGNAFPIDCHALALDLGFDGIAENSLDAVSDRDFVAEFLFWASLVQTHLSRLAEDLVWWSSPNFDFVRIDERYSTGSSIMPQKRNPDSLELLRGKAGRVFGNLIGLLTMLKGLPTAYNKDLQEDKEPLFDTIDTLAVALPIATGVINTIQVNADRMAEALSDGMLATELADYLVAKGVPFRESHHLIGQAVRRTETLGCTLRTLPLQQYQDIDPRFASDLFAVLDARQSTIRRDVPCGTSPRAVQAQIDRARTLLLNT